MGNIAKRYFLLHTYEVWDKIKNGTFLFWLFRDIIHYSVFSFFTLFSRPLVRISPLSLLDSHLFSFLPLSPLLYPSSTTFFSTSYIHLHIDFLWFFYCHQLLLLFLICSVWLHNHYFLLLPNLSPLLTSSFSLFPALLFTPPSSFLSTLSSPFCLLFSHLFLAFTPPIFTPFFLPLFLYILSLRCNLVPIIWLDCGEG